MALKPENMPAFASENTLALIAIIVDVLGRDAADRIAKEWEDIREGKKPVTCVEWPRF